MPLFVAESDTVVNVRRSMDESDADIFALWCEYDSVNRVCTVGISFT